MDERLILVTGLQTFAELIWGNAQQGLYYLSNLAMNFGETSSKCICEVPSSSTVRREDRMDNDKQVGRCQAAEQRLRGEMLEE